jgi:cysteine synthase B
MAKKQKTKSGSFQPTRGPASTRNLPAGVGNTALVSLHAVLAAIGQLHAHLELWGKCEMLNLGGSSKARTAFYLVQDAISSERLRRGQVVVLPSSGNTAVGVASECARRGISCLVFIPEHAGPEKINVLRYFGAEVITTPSALGSDGAYEAAVAHVRRNPKHSYLLDQYAERAAWLAHFETTGPEIWAQTFGQVTHFIAATGTGGTLVGTGRSLKARNPQVKVVAVQPDGLNEHIPGLRYLGEGAWIPPIYDSTVVDENVYVTMAEAMRYVRLCASIAGVLIGPSSGAALAAATRICSRLKSGNVVVLFPDAMDKYAGTLATFALSGASQTQNGDSRL